MSDDLQPELSLSRVVVPLLKGVLYREDDSNLWNDLCSLQARIRDYVSVLGLRLLLDEAEGYAFLQSIPVSEEEKESIPRLIPKRPLSFPVSLLLALLRKKLAEFDTSGESTRLILSKEQLVDMIKIFLPETTNEIKLLQQIETYLKKVVELGFLRKLRGSHDNYEVKRILKTFVDAQWLADFDTRLTEYKNQIRGDMNSDTEGDWQ
jgi:Domain of unknown function (DUF4194)